MMTNNENKMANPPEQEQKSTHSENPMKSVQTKPLPTKMVFFSEHGKKKESNSSSSK